MKKSLSIVVLVLVAIGCGDGSTQKLSIWEAAEQGEMDVLLEHLDTGTNINAKQGRTWMEASPLHHAVKGGHLNVVKLLIEKGADVNALGIKTPLGSSVTPLDVAVDSESGNVGIAEFLREHGAKLASELDSE